MSAVDRCIAFQSQTNGILPSIVPCHHTHQQSIATSVVGPTVTFPPSPIFPHKNKFKGKIRPHSRTHSSSKLSLNLALSSPSPSTSKFYFHNILHSSRFQIASSSSLSSRRDGYQMSSSLTKLPFVKTFSSKSDGATSQVNIRPTLVSSSIPIFSTKHASNEDEIERDEEGIVIPNPDGDNNDDFSGIKRPIESVSSIDDDGFFDGDGDGSELYNFDDEELLEILADPDDDGSFEIGDLLELQNILDEELVLDERDELDEFSDLLDTNGFENQKQPIADTSNDSSLERSLQGQSASTISSPLEEALLQGVVPANAGVGSNCLPGDYGFDPLDFATKDYFKRVQNFLLALLPPRYDDDVEGNISGDEEGEQTTRTYTDSCRPSALILRDYREAEIRHGRLAMLAAIFWPLQEIIDRLFIPERFGETTIIYGGVTLPFLSLLMTLFMMLLGYLDIYANAIKAKDAGDAFLPGECFWDPLSMLAGTSDEFKSNMQLIELSNGRWAMIAVASYILQEAIMHKPLIALPWNQVLFEPAFEIPAVQAYLDYLFS